MSHALLDWWPVLAALATVILMFADIRSQSKQTRDDLKEHRKESAESSKAMSAKVDGLVSDVGEMNARLAVVEDRTKRDESMRLKAVK